MKPYLDLLSIKDTVKLTKLIVSCHSLQIKLGRHTQPKTPCHFRLCHECGLLEDNDEKILNTARDSNEQIRQNTEQHQ